MLLTNPNQTQTMEFERRSFNARAPTIMKALMLAAASIIATQAAFAQDTGPRKDTIEEVVVTGTRIVRDGYESPTPVTVIDISVLESQSSTGNVADSLNLQPVFQVSDTPESRSKGVSSGTQGINALNLRGAGVSRTLVLLNGQRSVPSLLNGAVDVNNFPHQLISRVDVVTGGASAVYGSDAVAGVVNSRMMNV